MAKANSNSLNESFIMTKVVCKDENGQVIDDMSYETNNKYATWEEAIDAANDQMLKIANENGYDLDSCEFEDTDNSRTYFFPDGFTYTFSMIETPDTAAQAGDTYESVAQRFSRLRKMFEGAEDDNDTKDGEGENKDGEGEGEGSGEGEGENKDNDDDNKDNDDNDEVLNMKAVKLKVEKGSEEDLKKELKK